jgi:hypothetical protein
MCKHCHLAAPCGPEKVCHACAVALRAEARRGLDAIERYLDEWALLGRWLADEE